ncbi:DUF6266 family protein [Pedobacter sp. BMA]|uniref:DUF6266 family protein n=1 Tax=Pedobacter sp. BMA TaxID=1663685 RepID=UPI00064AB5B2|nr:DUF6266 family protein [Pedobacter sp. BMA]KLT63916.1 hypothetical protein AB669_19495 [Pedobacter sp. BMA]
MAKLKKGIMGPLSGKIGPVVGSSWRGVDYIRSAPIIKDPMYGKSEKQIAHQQKFKFMTRFLEPFHPYVAIGFYKPNLQNIELNVAFSYNFEEALLGINPDFEIDYSKFSISRGIQSGLTDLEFSWVSASEVLLTWKNESGYHARYDDQVMLAIYAPAIHAVTGSVIAAQRRDGRISYTLPDKFVDKVLEVYVGVVTSIRKKSSNSQYLGRKEFL